MGQTSGRWDSRCVSPFLKTADTFAVRQSNGRVPMFSDLWKMSKSAGDRVSVQFFRTALGIWSGPQALNGLIDLQFAYSHCVYGDVTNTGVLWGIKVQRDGSIFSCENTLELFQEDLCLLLTITHKRSILF